MEYCQGHENMSVNDRNTVNYLRHRIYVHMETRVDNKAPGDAIATVIFIYGKGKIHFKNFLNTMSRRLHKPESAQEIIKHFKIFDRNNSGFVSVAEIRNVLTTIGDCLNDDEVDELIRQGDLDGTGFINYEEFVLSMCH